MGRVYFAELGIDMARFEKKKKKKEEALIHTFVKHVLQVQFFQNLKNLILSFKTTH